jgi:hypothetical protein
MTHARLLWTEQIQKELPTDEVQFILDPALGLSDIDFHQVTDAGWVHMKAPNPNTPASLVAAPGATVGELQKALDALVTKGGYTKVEITIRNP